MSDGFESILKTNALLRFIYENAKVNAILVMDADGFILHLNEAFQHSYGYTLDDLSGKHTRVLFTEDDQKRLMPEMEIETVKQHGFAMDRNYIVHRDGACIWTSGESVFTQSENGSAFIIKIIQNIHEQKVMEKFLTESQSFSENVVAAISDALLVVDTDGKILKANKCFHELFNPEQTNMEGMPLTQLQDPFFSSAIFAKTLQNLKETGSVAASEQEWQAMDNRQKAFTVKARLLDGKLIDKKILFVIRDVTEDRKAKAIVAESAERFRFLTEAMPQKVWTANAGGHKTFFNKHWMEYTGLSEEALKGLGWTECIHPDDWKQNGPRWREKVVAGSDYEFEHRLRNKHGEYRWHLSRGIAQKDGAGNVVLWLGTSTDTHDQKMFSQQLEQKIEERTRALQEVNAQLQQSNEELQQFAFVSSHDLQEPLRKILIFGDQLRLQAGPHLSTQERGNLDKILQSAHRMTHLIKDILEYSTLSGGNHAVPFETVDLNAVLQSVLEDLEVEILQKDAVVNVAPLPAVPAIEVQIQQLFYNLLSNSLKFSVAGKKPEISISAFAATAADVQAQHLPEDKRYHKLVFTDNGIGFNPESAKRIFTMFHRLHSRNEYTGTGIGLALCKKVVLNHGGAIYAVSQPGAGAAFHVLLPAAY